MLALADPGLAFDVDAHAYTLKGVRVPSVTQVLQQTGYIRFDGVPVHILEAARERGQRVHQALHYLFEDDLDEGTVGEEIAGYLQSARAWIESSVRETVAVEARLSSARFNYAGTVDLLAVLTGGVLTVVDFKTGDPADVAADLQTAAYLQAVVENTKPRGVLARLSVRLHRDGRTGTETPYTDYQDWARFHRALCVVHDQSVRPAHVAWDEDR